MARKARNPPHASPHGVYRRLPREALRRLGDVALPLREIAYEVGSSSFSHRGHHRRRRNLVVCAVGSLFAADPGMTEGRTRSFLITLMWIGFGAIALTVTMQS